MNLFENDRPFRRLWDISLPVVLDSRRVLISGPVDGRSPMTESEWLTSTSPAALYEFVRERMTERQEAFCMAAIDEACTCRPMFPISDRRLSDEVVLVQESDCPATGKRFRCDLLRDICGSPFRRTLIGIPEDGLTSINLAPGAHTVEWMDPSVLSWNDGLIPTLARSVYGERCGHCRGKKGRSAKTEGGYDSEWIDCYYCSGTGLVPPRRDALPILADAVEEACGDVGCAVPEEVTKHLRDQRRCSSCRGRGRIGIGGAEEDECKDCGGRYGKRGTGWIKSDCGHFRGCFAVELLRGGE